MKTYADIGLFGNPFQYKVTIDYNDFKKYPFLKTESQKLTESVLKSSFLLGYDEPVYYVLIGERGIGKTSTLLWLYDIIQNEQNPLITGKYERSIKGMGSLYGLIQKMLPDKRVSYYENGDLENTFKFYLKDKKYYWLIDVPDKISKKDYDFLLQGLEILLGFKNINIFIAMNFSHYQKTFNYSEIMGKFTAIRLHPFSLKETEELIRKRILSFSIDKQHPPKLFSKNVINTIHKLSKGIPRNILASCDILLNKFLFYENVEMIDENFAKNILGEDLAKRIIEERINNDKEKIDLNKLYMFIKSEFNGEVKRQKYLEERVNEVFGWSRSTIIKKIKWLESLGLITITKSMEDGWTNIIKVVV